MNTRHSQLRQRRGYVLPAVMLFLALAFGAWVIMFRSSATLIRVEQARVQRGDRTKWTATAMADGLRLLETGEPPLDSYQCKLAVTQDSETRWFVLSFEKIHTHRWAVTCAPTTAGAAYPVAPSTF